MVGSGRDPHERGGDRALAGVPAHRGIDESRSRGSPDDISRSRQAAADAAPDPRGRGKFLALAGPASRDVVDHHSHVRILARTAPRPELPAARNPREHAEHDPREHQTYDQLPLDFGPDFAALLRRSGLAPGAPDGPVSGAGVVRLQEGATDLHIEFTALSLKMPERTRFRYRLFFVTLIVVAALVAVGGHPYDDPSAVGARSGAHEAYALYRHTLDLGKVTGKNLSYGVIRGFGITGGFDINSKTDAGYNSKKRMLVLGPTIMFDVPGFLNVSLVALHESNAPYNGFTQKATDRYRYDTHAAVTYVQTPGATDGSKKSMSKHI